jgi:hypothetical protein
VNERALVKNYSRNSAVAPRLRASQIGPSVEAQSALNELLAEGSVRKLDAFYLAGHEPSVSSEKVRIIRLLETKSKLFPSSFLLPKSHALKSFARSALAELVDDRVILELPLHGKKSGLVYIHHRHMTRGEPTNQTLAKEAIEERILAGYRDGSSIRQRRSILAERSLSLPH